MVVAHLPPHGRLHKSKREAGTHSKLKRYFTHKNNYVYLALFDSRLANVSNMPGSQLGTYLGPASEAQN